MITKNNVHIDTALRTPQFWLLWTNLCCNVTAGIGVISVAKVMIGDIFGTMMPHIVNSAFAATYVSMIGVANMVGRLSWASASDYLGRKNTFAAFFALGIPLYLSIPLSAQATSPQAPELAQMLLSSGINPLYAFYGTSMLIFTMYGGGFATIPAYLADLFGTKYVGGIHGRLLTAWSVAGIVGPLAISYLRESSANKAMHDLASKVAPELFEETFGSSKSELESLINAKTVTISKLMELLPGVADPTPALYDTTMTAMAGILGIALISNSLVRPVHSKYHIQNTHPHLLTGNNPPGIKK